MKRKVQIGLWFIVGTMCGIRLMGRPCERLTVPVKEDYERSVKFYLEDGAVARYADVTLTTAYYTEPGGLQDRGRDKAINDAAVAELTDRWPQLVHVNNRRKGDWTEVTLKDRRSR